MALQLKHVRWILPPATILTDSGVKVRYRSGVRQAHGNNLKEGCCGSGGWGKGSRVEDLSKGSHASWFRLVLVSRKGKVLGEWISGGALPKMENSWEAVLVNWWGQFWSPEFEVYQEEMSRPVDQRVSTWRQSQGASSTELIVKVHKQQRNALNFPQTHPLGSFLTIIDI